MRKEKYPIHIICEFVNHHGIKQASQILGYNKRILENRLRAGAELTKTWKPKK